MFALGLVIDVAVSLGIVSWTGYVRGGLSRL